MDDNWDQQPPPKQSPQPSNLKVSQNKQQQASPPEAQRLPPNSIEAEQGILGCMLLDPNEVIPLCIDKLRAGVNDFYDLKHQAIYGAMVQMYDLREDINVITLMQFLKDRNQLNQVGGIAYLSELPDKVPSGAMASVFIDIVREKYLLRLVVREFTEIVGQVMKFEGEVDEKMDEIERRVMKISDQRITQTTPNIKELALDAIDRMEILYNRKGELIGLPTGYRDLDRATGGLADSEMIIIAGRPSTGKAQPIHTSCVLTPDGWRTMGDIKLGDMVIGADGKPKKVLGVYPQGIIPVVEVRFSDGTKTRCSLDHLWFTQTRNERRYGKKGSVKTTAEIARTIRREDAPYSPNHVIPVVAPVQYASRENLPLHPWLMGALLGDGHLSGPCVQFSKPEVDVQEKFKSLLPEGDCTVVASPDGMTLRVKRRKRAHHAKSETARIITELGLVAHSECKFIPRDYLYADERSRLELLRGLVDTDGYVCDTGCSVEYSSSSKQLANDVAHLARSLGAVVSEAEPRIPHYTHKGERKAGRESYRLTIRFLDRSIIPVSSVKHLAKWRTTVRLEHKSIVEIVPIGSEECQCIQVDSLDGLYVTDQFIVTHNTSLAMNIVENVALRQKLPVGVFSLEMTGSALVSRMICSESRVSMTNIRYNALVAADWPKLSAAASTITQAQIYIDDSSDASVMQIRSRARRWKQQYGIKLLVIDYLQLMNALHTKRSYEGRQQEIEEISKGIKSLAKELKIPVIVLSQLNRELDKEKTRKPRLADLRGSGSIEQDADTILMLYSETQPDSGPDGPDVIPVNVWLGKQRNGPSPIIIPLTFFKLFTRFESAARVSQDDVPGDGNNQQQRMPYAES